MNIFKTQQARDLHEASYGKALQAYERSTKRVARLGKEVGVAAIERARPCFQQMVYYQQSLSSTDVEIREMEGKTAQAKRDYNTALRGLERINNEIHALRLRRGRGGSSSARSSGSSGSGADRLAAGRGSAASAISGPDTPSSAATPADVNCREHQGQSVESPSGCSPGGRVADRSMSGLQPQSSADVKRGGDGHASSSSERLAPEEATTRDSSSYPGSETVSLGGAQRNDAPATPGKNSPTTASGMWALGDPG